MMLVLQNFVKMPPWAHVQLGSTMCVTQFYASEFITDLLLDTVWSGFLKNPDVGQGRFKIKKYKKKLLSGGLFSKKSSLGK